MAASGTEPTSRIWDRSDLANPHVHDDKADRVRAMFDAIAPTYERVNSVASLGQDARWRRMAIRMAEVRPTDLALDLCCGTGDMIRELDAGPVRPRLIIGVDFAARMLGAGCYRGVRTPVQLCRADGLRLPLADASVDLVTCAFGVRNFQDLAAGLAEMRRVLRPEGRAVVLEFARPGNRVLRWAHGVYTGRVLPRIAAWISRDTSGAYEYLPASIQTFEPREAMVQRLREAGFSPVVTKTMNLGGVVVYRAGRG